MKYPYQLQIKLSFSSVVRKLSYGSLEAAKSQFPFWEQRAAMYGGTASFKIVDKRSGEVVFKQDRS